ncbi:MAG: phage baseplate assembly protein W [Crocinitomix sp.]|jgi:phage baseplate assembly protein W
MKTKELDTLFLGRGWGFPPTFNKGDRSLEMVSGETDIQQSLAILLGTTLGERTVRPDFGCRLDEYLFQPITPNLTTLIKRMVEKAIIKHESRIELLELNLNLEREVEGILLLELEYLISSTNSRSNYVYPFYLEEGTNT